MTANCTIAAAMSASGAKLSTPRRSDLVGRPPDIADGAEMG